MLVINWRPLLPIFPINQSFYPTIFTTRLVALSVSFTRLVNLNDAVVEPRMRPSLCRRKRTTHRRLEVQHLLTSYRRLLCLGFTSSLTAGCEVATSRGRMRPAGGPVSPRLYISRFRMKLGKFVLANGDTDNLTILVSIVACISG